MSGIYLHLSSSTSKLDSGKTWTAWYQQGHRLQAISQQLKFVSCLKQCCIGLNVKQLDINRHATIR